jgi:hypothetical protein
MKRCRDVLSVAFWEQRSRDEEDLQMDVGISVECLDPEDWANFFLGTARDSH